MNRNSQMTYFTCALVVSGKNLKFDTYIKSDFFGELFRVFLNLQLSESPDWKASICVLTSQRFVSYFVITDTTILMTHELKFQSS